MERQKLEASEGVKLLKRFEERNNCKRVECTEEELRMLKEEGVISTGAIRAPKIVYSEEDVVNHPNHYTSGKFEVIEYIKDQLTEEEFRGYIKGNLIKYISRERHKNGDEDLKKAEFYIHYLMKDK